MTKHSKNSDEMTFYQGVDTSSNYLTNGSQIEEQHKEEAYSSTSTR